MTDVAGYLLAFACGLSLGLILSIIKKDRES